MVGNDLGEQHRANTLLNADEFLTPDAVVIYSSRAKLLRLVLGAAVVFLTLSLFLCKTRIINNKTGLMACVLFGAGLGFGLVMWFRKRPALIINSVGLFDQSSTLNRVCCSLGGGRRHLYFLEHGGVFQATLSLDSAQGPGRVYRPPRTAQSHADEGERASAWSAGGYFGLDPLRNVGGARHDHSSEVSSLSRVVTFSGCERRRELFAKLPGLLKIAEPGARIGLCAAGGP